MEQSNKTFYFRETPYMSRGILKLPCQIGEHKFYIKTEILKGDIPWLIGRETMENMDMVNNVKKEKVKLGELNGMEAKIRIDNKGHLRLGMGIETADKIWKGEEWSEIRGERHKKLWKLHLQFGHPGWERLWRLLEEANGNYEEDKEKGNLIKKELQEVSEGCETCLKYKKTPARPVVGLPMAKLFNEVVSMDLGEVDGEKFLIMVDMATKYCQAGWIKDKNSETIIDMFMQKWIGIFGAPKKVFSDNGREFNNEKFRIMAEKFNIIVKNTPGESPWSNGLCEKMVGLLKETMRKIREEGGGSNKNIIINWAVSARNCLSNFGGYSPNQLVFGKNPILPNVNVDENPPMLEEGNEEEIVRRNLVAMNNARVTQVEQEASKRLKIALKKQIREHKLEDAQLQDEVYYKREGEKEWRGPARVIGIDGKTVIVKHGGDIREIARIHITRIQGRKEDKMGPKEEKTQNKNEKKQIGENIESGSIQGGMVGIARMGRRDNEEMSESQSDESDEEAEEGLEEEGAVGGTETVERVRGGRGRCSGGF